MYAIIVSHHCNLFRYSLRVILEWDVSPEGEEEVESVRNAVMQSSLGVITHQCTKDPVDPTWGVTQTDHRRLLKMKISRWGCTLGPKLLVFTLRVLGMLIIARPS